MNALPHPAVSAAELRSIDGRDSVCFELFRTVAPEHAGWITYRIEWSQVDPPGTCVLADTGEPSLFLNVEPIDELQSIIDGIRGVLRGDLNLYRFEPIDEGEFVFEVSSCGGSYLVRCHPQPIDRELRWFEGVEVTAAELTHFIDRLGAIQLSTP